MCAGPHADKETTRIGWVSWVMGQELNGSLGSWVTLSDPFPALIQGVNEQGIRPTRVPRPKAQPTQNRLEMWANIQRDGRPAEYRWRPLFNAAKFG